MEGTFDIDVLAKLPLAESALTLLRWMLPSDGIEKVFEDNRGRAYTKEITFGNFVTILGDCLTGPWKSARAGLLAAVDEEQLGVSTRAFYSKLAGMPVEVGTALLRYGFERTEQVLPKKWEERPKSLNAYQVLLLDGKTIKHVPRRGRALQWSNDIGCKLLGGKSLVLCNRWTKLVVDLEPNLDGEVNELTLVSGLFDRVGHTFTEPFLIVGDRGFGIFEVCRQIQAANGDFMLRKHGQTKFVADPNQQVKNSKDRFGREVTETIGWIVRGKKVKSRPQESIPVRMITVKRDNQDLVFITSLVDSKRFPVDDVLDAYLDRWDIENVFQQVTQVFNLKELFSTSPKGMMFQQVYCFLIYNAIHVVKSIIAHHKERPVQSLSSEMLFRSIREQLIAANQLIANQKLEGLIPEFKDVHTIREFLVGRLADCWSVGWPKANWKPRDPSKPTKPKPIKVKQTKSHDSVHRILVKLKT